MVTINPMVTNIWKETLEVNAISRDIKETEENLR